MSGEGVRIFIFGLGYSAGVFARAMQGYAPWIGGTVRSLAKANQLAAEGFEAFPFDGSGPGEGIRRVLAEATHVIISVPPGEGLDPVLVHHGADIGAANNLRWLGYLSTVGVYGNYAGAWVSERTTPHPLRGRSTARLAAEKAWSELAGARQVPLGIFRLAGIYGPGRNAFVNLDDGTAQRIIKPDQVFNRIHVDDIATTLALAIARPATRIYNVADDEPAPPQDVISFAAKLMKVRAPKRVPFEEATLSPMARSFYADNRRVLNERIKEELGVRLRYPSYRHGLTAMWEAGTWR